MKRHAIFIVALILCIAPAARADDAFDRRAMLQSLVDQVVLPGQSAFIHAADDLLARAEAFLAAPDADTLASLQEAWRGASNAWREIAMLTFDLRVTALHNQIDKPPLNVEFVEDFLNGDATINEKAVNGLGSTTRGLPAIEYLIFAPDSSPEGIVASLDDPRRADYLRALAQNIAGKSAELRHAWSPEGRDYAKRFVNADQAAGKIQGSINMLANKIYEWLAASLEMWLGDPAGITTGEEPQPELVESPRSRHSLAQIKHNLIGLRRLYTGGDGLGLDDYLDYFGAQAESMPLSQMIKERFDAALAAADNIETPLYDAVSEDAESVAALYEAMRQLLIPLRVDMKSQLGIVLTFSDRDGDQ